MHCFLNSWHLSIDCLSICLGRIISRSAWKERPGWRNELCGLVVCKWKSATSFTSWQHGFTESNRQALLHANFVLQCGVRLRDQLTPISSYSENINVGKILMVPVFNSMLCVSKNPIESSAFHIHLKTQSNSLKHMRVEQFTHSSILFFYTGTCQ